MQPTFASFLLALAKDWDLRSMSKGFNERNFADNAIPALIVVGIIALVVAVLLLYDKFAHRHDEAKTFDSPPELFGELCRAHGLGWSQRRMLKRLAADWGLATPASLFLEPNFFQAGSLPAAWESRSHQLARLRERLFGPLA